MVIALGQLNTTVGIEKTVSIRDRHDENQEPISDSLGQS
jgi:hypothetical protein